MTTTIVVHQPPRFGQVVRQQIRAMTVSLRIPAMIGAALAAVATLLAFADFFQGRGGVRFAPELSLIPVFAGVVVAASAWLAERRQKAAFFWSLPVDRSQHALAKVVAGWIILMIVVTAFVLWLLILALITKGNITGGEIVRVLPASWTEGSIIDPAMLQTIRWIPQPILWLTPFTAATGAYVVASAVTLGFRNPLRWIGGAIAGGLLIGAIGQGLESEDYWEKLAYVMSSVMRGRYGLDGLMNAGIESLNTNVRLTTGQVLTVWHSLPSIRDWIIATLLWTGLGLAGLLAGLWRHRERR